MANSAWRMNEGIGYRAFCKPDLSSSLLLRLHQAPYFKQAPDRRSCFADASQETTRHHRRGTFEIAKDNPWGASLPHAFRRRVTAPATRIRLRKSKSRLTHERPPA